MSDQPKSWLGRLVRVVFDSLHRLDSRVAGKLRRLDDIVIRGGSKGIVRKRTGSWFGDQINSLWFSLWQKLDKLDTWVFYRDRPYQAKVCRVRSKGEKKIANWLTDHGVEFVYEKRLRLGRQVLYPDFYLPKYEAYIEFWGPEDSKYKVMHAKKVDLYQRYSVPIISLYPKDLGRLGQVIPHNLHKIIGQ